MHELIELWKTWWLTDGKLPDSTLLWNKPIYFWGRIGTVIQIVAGLFLIAEVIGPQHLRAAGRFLDGRPLLKLLVKIGNHMMKKIKNWITRLVPSDNSQNAHNPSESLSLTITDARAAILTLLLSGLALYPIIVKAIENLNNSPFSGALASALFILLAIVFGFIFGLIALTLCGLILDWFLFRPLAWILDRESVDRVLKAISIIIFLIGSHFSLLAQ